MFSGNLRGACFKTVDTLPMSAPTEPLYIVIPRWDEFQHRDMARSTVPPWIKTYTKLLHDDEYLALTGDQRAILHGLWLEYASSRRRLRLDTRSLSSRLRLRVTSAQLEALNHAGFIEFSASKYASNLASLEVEVEVEVEKDQKQVLAQQTLSEREDDPLSAGTTAPSRSLSVRALTSQHLVAHFVEASKALGGENPPSRVTGHVARLVGEMLAEGTDPERVRAGLDLLLEKRLHPSTLPSLVHEASLPRGRSGRNGYVSAQDVMDAAVNLAKEGR